MLFLILISKGFQNIVLTNKLCCLTFGHATIFVNTDRLKDTRKSIKPCYQLQNCIQISTHSL